MSIEFYRTADENHVVSKTLSAVMTISTYGIKDKTSIINPVITINSASITSIQTCNYLYISEFSRYYYITNIEVVHKNLVEISCHVDVLYTYRSQIRNMKAVVIRSENYYNNYIPDNVPTYADQFVVTKAFPTTFDHSAACFEVITAGGGNS